MRDVVIVSSGGRGAWLAHQLQKKAFQTTVFDISALQPLSSAEREGPFGVFLPSHLSDLQKSYLCGDHFYSVPQGFSFFIPNRSGNCELCPPFIFGKKLTETTKFKQDQYPSHGPVELRGALHPFFMETCLDFQVCHSVLNQESFIFTHLTEDLFSKKDKKLRGFSNRITIPSPFSKNKLGLLSRKKVQKVKESIKSNLFLYLAKEFSGSYTESFSYGFSPLFSDYLFRESSQRYFADIKCSLKKEGVEWLDVSSADLSSSDNLLRDFKLTKTHIEFKWNGEIQRSRFLIWTLSGPETLHFFSNSMFFLFPNWNPPMKIWKRFSLSWDQGAFEKVIPLLLLVLPEYTKSNHVSHGQEPIHSGREGFLSLKRHPEAAKVDLWMLCPYADRFNKFVLSAYLKAALDRLNRLFPGFSINGYLPEQGICHDYFVLYEQMNLFNKKNRDKKFQNRLLHLNPEAAEKIDAYSLMRQSSDILENLLKNKV
ncbi:MAG: hypothetical protein OXM55_02735 [Bdellovibrionales bacterium]|nr:hypothetical protein [Bdellovibrionales bacterium]